jgi:uncharacterized protein YcnI
MRFFVALCALLVAPVLASAHVVVRPNEVGVGAYQTFLVSVPTEKDIATTEVRLVIPEGLQSARPNVKPGWNVTIVKEGEGEEAVVTELIWKGGSVPADMRDEFYFSAKTPATPGELIWKAYQTYSDGSVVAWDATAEEQPKDEAGEDDFSSKGPYSKTMVIDDLSEETEPAPIMVQVYPTDVRVALEHYVLVTMIMAGAALVLGILTRYYRRRE